MTTPRPPRKFDTLDEKEKARIRANIKKLEAAGVREDEVEKYLSERENILRPSLPPAAPKDATSRVKVRKGEARGTGGIPAIGKTAEGAHILPRMTITQPSSPSAANKAHRPIVGEEVREALPLAAAAAGQTLNEVLPHNIPKSIARGLARTPTDLAAGMMWATGRDKAKENLLGVSDKIAGAFGERPESPAGKILDIASQFAPIPFGVTKLTQLEKLKGLTGGRAGAVRKAAHTVAKNEVSYDDLLAQLGEEVTPLSTPPVPPASPVRRPAIGAKGRRKTGAVDQEMLLHLAGPAVGAATGAATSDDPVEGALIGLGLGAVAGKGGGALLTKQPRLPRSRAMTHVVNQIDFAHARPPIVGMQVVEEAHYAIDRWSQTDRLGRSLEKLGVKNMRNPLHKKNLVLSSPTRTHQAIDGGGLIDPDTLDKLGPDLKSVFEPLGAGMEDVQTISGYLMAVRNKFREGQLITDAQGVRRARGLDVYDGNAALMADTDEIVRGATPEMVKFADRWRQYTDGLGEYAVRRGLWTPEQWEKIRDSDAIYVNFRRIRDAAKSGKPMSAPGNAMHIKSGVQTFSGSKKQVADLAISMAEYTDALIKRADRYAFAQSMRDGIMDAVNLGNKDGLLLMSPVPKPKLQAIADEKTRLALEAAGVSADDASTLFDLYTPGITPDAPVLTLNKAGGGHEYWGVHAPGLVKTLENLTPDRSGMRNILFRTAMTLKHVTTAAKTSNNPGFFAGTNVLRDPVDAWSKSRDGLTFAEIGKGWYTNFVGSGAGAPVLGALAGGAVGSQGSEDSAAGTVGAIVGGALGVSVKGRLQPRGAVAKLQEMETMGGLGTTSQVFRQASPKAMVSRFAATTRYRRFASVVSEITGKPLHALETIANVSDAAPRAAAWEAAVRSKSHLVKSGKWTPADLRYYAATQARGATIDFGRKAGSDLVLAFTDVIPFLNAALQGSLRFGQAAHENPARMVAASAGIATLSAISWALNERGENPLLLNSRVSTERAAFLHFPLPHTDTMLRIPLTQEMGVVAAGVGYGLAQLNENDPNAASRQREAFLRLIPDVYFPVASEFQEVQENEVEYGRRPIESADMKRQLPEDRVLPTTRPMYTGLARGIRKIAQLPLIKDYLPGRDTFKDLSPVQAEHMVKGPLGNFADIVADLGGDKLARAFGESERGAKPPPRDWTQRPMNPLRAILTPSPPTRTEAENVLYRTLGKQDEAEASLRATAERVTGRPDSADVVNIFLRDPQRGGWLPRDEEGYVNFGWGDQQRADLREVRLMEEEVREAWQRGEIDERTHRAEVARLRRNRQDGYRAVLKQLHDAGITTSGPANYPR